MQIIFLYQKVSAVNGSQRFSGGLFTVTKVGGDRRDIFIVEYSLAKCANRVLNACPPTKRREGSAMG